MGMGMEAGGDAPSCRLEVQSLRVVVLLANLRERVVETRKVCTVHAAQAQQQALPLPVDFVAEALAVLARCAAGRG